MNYFIGDLHFGHNNVLRYDSRPFKNIEEHDRVLIENWNSVVGIDDDVYILGDISWYNAAKTIEIFEQLNGNIHWIIGNHDSKLLKNRELKNLFCEITQYKELDIGNGKKIVLQHYPSLCFKNRSRGWYHLYAHVHNSIEWELIEKFKSELVEKTDSLCEMYNCGCMLLEYTPRTLEEIIEIYKEK